ncbi:MAG: response regulator [Phycisphaerae bacterium]
MMDAKKTGETPLHILLVEDDDDHAEIVMRTIAGTQTPSTITRVKEGESALRYLRRSDEYLDAPRADIILLDLKLPGRSGIEILREIKNDTDLKRLPVVILSTSSAETDRCRAYENHANSYVVKPVNFVRFRQLVADLCMYWGVWSHPHSEN